MSVKVISGGGDTALIAAIDALKTGIILAAGSAVIGKTRLCTATGDELSDDDTDGLKMQTSGLTGLVWSEKLLSTHRQCLLGFGTAPAKDAGKLYGFIFNNLGSGYAHCHIHDFYYANQTSSVDVDQNILFEPSAGPNQSSHIEFTSAPISFSTGLRFSSDNPCECYVLYKLD